MQLRLTMVLPALILSAVWVCGCSEGRSEIPPAPIPVAALQQDLNILETTLQEIHPGYLDYTDSADLRNRFAEAGSRLTNELTGLQFFKVVLPLVAAVRCSHTTVRPAAADRERPFSRLLPFEFICRERKVFIRKGPAGLEGAEVTTINGIGAPQILDTLLACIPADGYNETYKYFLLSHGGLREGYALFFGQPHTFTLQYIDSGRRHGSTLPLPALPPEKATPASPLPDMQLTLQKNVAVLRLSSFRMKAMTFADRISTLFDTLQRAGVDGLIIDLRGNGGGINDNVSRLFSYVAAGPFVHLQQAERKAGAPTFIGYFSKGKEHFTARAGAGRPGALYSVRKEYAGLGWTAPAQRNRFGGRLVVLISGGTASAASEFAALARSHRRAVIVGEETGGCYYGASGGKFVTLQLPASGLEVTIPLVRIRTAVAASAARQPKGRGTLADYPLQPSIKDLLHGRDAQLALAVGLLQNGE